MCHFYHIFKSKCGTLDKTQILPEKKLKEKQLITYNISLEVSSWEDALEQVSYRLTTGPDNKPENSKPWTLIYSQGPTLRALAERDAVCRFQPNSGHIWRQSSCLCVFRWKKQPIFFFALVGLRWVCCIWNVLTPTWNLTQDCKFSAPRAPECVCLHTGLSSPKNQSRSQPKRSSSCTNTFLTLKQDKSVAWAEF